MAYQQNIPQSTDLISQSQADILGNFQSLYNWVQTNHVTFDIGDAGKHKWISLPSQAAIPPTGSAFTATEVGLYNAVNSITSQQELYITKVNNGPTTVQIPATASILSLLPVPVLGSQGWTYLPSGILLKWGQVAYAFGAPSTLTFPAAVNIPAFNQIFCAQLTFKNTAVTISNLQIWDYNNVQIRYTGANVAGSINYFAVGY